MSINKFKTLKTSFFFPSYSSFSLLLLPSFRVIPTALSLHTGKQDFLLYRKGFISATWRQARGGISSAIQAIVRQTDHVIYNSCARKHADSINLKHPLTRSWYSFVALEILASLSQFNLSPEPYDKMLADVSPMLSGARENQPLEQSPSQTNTGLHQGFPQTSTHFSVPAMGFFSPSNTHKHIYIHRKAEGKCACHRIFQERGRFYHFV